MEQLLRTGFMLSELLENLVESLPEGAYPGESNPEVVLEMLIGSLRPVAEAAGEESVRRAVALIAATSDRTLTDLSRATALARRREFEGGSYPRERRSG